MGKNLCLITLMVTLFSSSALGGGNEIIDVCVTCEVNSITDAVDRTVAGGTIRVHAGTYSESNIVLNKPVRLEAAKGEAKPVIDGRGNGNVFLVLAAGVSITGFTIRGSGQSYTEEFSGIKIMDTTNCLIENNDVDGNTYGIYLGGVRGCTIRGNRVRGQVVSESAGGDGIHLWHSNSVTVEGNSVSGHRDGIYFEFVEDSFVRQNESRGNLRYGLHFMYSNRDTYEGNSFVGNGSGVAVMYSKKIQMTGNLFEGSLGGASYGILLKEISDSDIRGNRFLRNTVGAFLDGTTRSIFSGNIFRSNGWALRALGNTDGNTIVGNDFLANTFDLSTNASRNMNHFSGNYWSRYHGIDLDRDGVGDSPYFPVQLSALLMEKYGASVLLTHSFFFSVLDEAESLFPVLTPDSFRDGDPRISRVTNL